MEVLLMRLLVMTRSWVVSFIQVKLCFCLFSKGPSVFCLCTGEAARLQQLEVQLLGESSTGFKVEAAQQSPGSK